LRRRKFIDKVADGLPRDDHSFDSFDLDLVDVGVRIFYCSYNANEWQTVNHIVLSPVHQLLLQLWEIAPLKACKSMKGFAHPKISSGRHGELLLSIAG
jgi:hypothetical protein